MTQPNPKFSEGEEVLVYSKMPNPLVPHGTRGVVVYSYFETIRRTIDGSDIPPGFVYLINHAGNYFGFIEEALRPLPKHNPGAWDESIFVPKDLTVTA